ncbi:hypothetical protein MTR_5g052160 [Medicago truncatula]|uniref:Uncharacterized protein n=1 Tax=Medicago truncatula TaxID=3880 RepID=A0A072UQ34_MEDTR|nr:hypothetical protein MTR_5g052160 [Medicago truncatula]
MGNQQPINISPSLRLLRQCMQARFDSDSKNWAYLTKIELNKQQKFNPQTFKDYWLAGAT